MKRLATPVLIAVALTLTACGSAATDAQQETTTSPSTTAPALSTSTTAIAVATTTTTGPTTPTTTSDSAGHGREVLREPGEHEGLGSYGDYDQPYSMVVPDSHAEIAPAPLSLQPASGPRYRTVASS